MECGAVARPAIVGVLDSVLEPAARRRACALKVEDSTVHVVGQYGLLQMLAVVTIWKHVISLRAANMFARCCLSAALLVQVALSEGPDGATNIENCAAGPLSTPSRQMHAATCNFPILLQ